MPLVLPEVLIVSLVPLSMPPGIRQGDDDHDVDDEDDDCHHGLVHNVHDNVEDDDGNSGCWLWRPKEQPALGRALALAKG